MVVISCFAFRDRCDFQCYGAKVQKPKRVFITGENYCFEQLLSYLKSLENKFELVYHQSDIGFDWAKFLAIRPYCSHIYAENCEINHPMITQLPLGFSPYYSIPKRLDIPKDILCYVNLGIYNDRELKFVNCRSIRLQCLEYFKSQPWAVVDEEKVSQEEFYHRLNRSKFVVCPTGYGLDTHRFYETVFIGSTPITQSTGLDRLHKHFGNPLIVDKWEDVTRDVLENHQYKEPDYQVFDTDYWLKPLN